MTKRCSSVLTWIVILILRYEADQENENGSEIGLGGQPTLTLPSISEDDEVDEDDDDGQRLLTTRYDIEHFCD